ncbi:MAG TPA: helix-turn-helix domain-containing protein [Alphaproteobacteria bacterium]|nr:helix-turn-helix domain-containing protein [Alphaproteobacteria bacterium]
MSKAGRRIIESAKEARAFVRGEMTEGFKVHVPERIDVRAVRKKTGLSQQQFALRIGVPVGTLRNWEQRRRAPEGPARVLLAMLTRRPTVVEETLGGTA